MLTFISPSLLLILIFSISSSVGKQQLCDSGVLPEERGWCVCWGNWRVCSATELSPYETDIYSWTVKFLCSPASLQTLQGRTGADGGADRQL